MDTCKPPYEEKDSTTVEVVAGTVKEQAVHRAQIGVRRTVSTPRAAAVRRSTVTSKASPYTLTRLQNVAKEVYSALASPYEKMCIPQGQFLLIDSTHFLIIGNNFKLSIS